MLGGAERSRVIITCAMCMNHRLRLISDGRNLFLFNPQHQHPINYYIMLYWRRTFPQSYTRDRAGACY